MFKNKILKYTISIFITVIIATSVVVYFETKDNTKIYRYRTTQDSLLEKRIKKLQKMDSQFDLNKLDLTGFKTLNISGSSRLVIHKLNEKFPTKPERKNIFIIDLQEEDNHFISEKPLHWYGYDHGLENAKPLAEISLKHKLRRLIYSGALTHTRESAHIQTEKELFASNGYQYLDFASTRKRIPEGEYVDTFIKTCLSLPSDSTKHFHCAAGQGRTSVGMVMFDIVKNHRNVALKDIVYRNYLIGSENLFDTSVWEGGSYSKQMLETRKNFIVNFYNFMEDPQGYGATTWTQWLAQNQKERNKI